MTTRPIDVAEGVWIPMSDGARLAARIWKPADAEASPVPAILEYIPYRLRDGTRARDEPMHGYFAAHGYAAVRVDLRGSGESDGFLADEYLPLEQDDALAAIDWLARQPWCSGAVGMIGKSWGGFNGLQVAARRPPALKAVVTVCSTVDRFADDIHYAGGCLLNDNLWWGAIMLAYQARPLDPRIAGPDWRQRWLDRLAAMPLWPKPWMEHQARDDYWKHGSACEDFAAIACPVLAVGGWADSYTNAVPRLLEGLGAESRGIIGPWAHIYPQDGMPGPAIGFLDEALRWWDQWLKGIDRGVGADPKLRAFIEESRPPAATLAHAPGRWVAEAEWPSPAIEERAFFPAADGTLRPDMPDGSPARLAVRSPLWTGTAAGEWMGTGVAGEMPGDQRPDDGLGLLFDTPPLVDDVEILGFPIVELELASDRAHGQLAVRLCEVLPDGASLRVSYAVLNLAHRDGSDAPSPMRPGETVRLRLPLKVCGHRFAAGSRIRVAVSTAYWPLVWPAREAATLTLTPAASRLLLPVRRPAGPEAPVAMPPAARGAAAPQTVLGEGRLERLVSFDQMTGEATYATTGEGGVFGEGDVRLDEIDVTLGHDLRRRLTIAADDPLSARSAVRQSYRMTVDGRRFLSESELDLTADAETFRLRARLRVFEDDALVFERDWDERVPRVHL